MTVTDINSSSNDQNMDRALTIAIGNMRALRAEAPEQRARLVNDAVETAMDQATPADLAETLKLLGVMAGAFAIELNPDDPYVPILTWARENRRSSAPAPDVR